MQINLSILTIIASFFFSSPGRSQNLSNLKQANYIEIRFFKGKQPAIYKTKRDMDLLYLKPLITKAQNKNDLVCDTTGEIIYYKDQTPVFKAYFCSSASGSRYKSTGGVMFNDGDAKIKRVLNYGSWMLIDEVYYQFQKQKLN
jgi:hypothetical protein